MAQHSTLSPADGIHKPYSFEFADASARASATNPVTGSAYTADDVGKLALQTDLGGSIWRLTATAPTWVKVAQQTDVDAVNTALTTHTSDTSNPHSVTAAQTGAATSAALTTHTGDTANPHSVTLAQIGALNAGSVTSISPSNYTPSAATLAGNLSGIDTALASAGGGTPGGSSGQIQYNDGASGFAGSAAKVSAAGAVDLPEIAAPSTPSSGFATVYTADGSSASAPPRLKFKDSSGLETTYLPMVPRKGVSAFSGYVLSNLAGALRLGPSSGSADSFTDSSDEFLAFALIRMPTSGMLGYSSNSNSYDNVRIRAYHSGGSAQGIQIRLKAKVQDQISIMEGNSNIQTANRYRRPSVGCVLVMFYQIVDVDGTRWIGASYGDEGLALATGAAQDFSDAGGGGMIEMGLAADGATLALGIVDGCAGTAGTGVTPFSSGASTPYSSVAASMEGLTKARNIFTQEGTLRNLTSGEIGGGGLTFDKLYLAEDCVTNASNQVTSWPANSASADSGAPAITLLETTSPYTVLLYQTDVNWIPS